MQFLKNLLYSFVTVTIILLLSYVTLVVVEIYWLTTNPDQIRLWGTNKTIGYEWDLFHQLVPYILLFIVAIFIYPVYKKLKKDKE